MSTKIVAIRHGKSEDLGDYESDSLRPLTKEGQDIQQRMSEHLKAEGLTPNLILNSPLLRAQQTAQILALNFDVDYLDEHALGNEFDSHTLMQRINMIGQGHTIFLVGHEPTLADFVNHLVGKAALPLGLSKSAAAVIEFEGKVDIGEGTFLKVYEPTDLGL